MAASETAAATAGTTRLSNIEGVMYSSPSSSLVTISASACAAASFISSLPRRGAHVEHAAEEAGKAAGVVDLVWIIRAAGGHHPDVRACFLRKNLRDGVGHREHDRIAIHGLDVLQRHHARPRQPDEHVGVLERVGGAALEPLLVGVLGEPLLHRVHVVGAP